METFRCALLELAVFFRKKGEAESKIKNQKSKVKIQQQEAKKGVENVSISHLKNSVKSTCRSDFCRHISKFQPALKIQKILWNREVNSECERPFVIITTLHFVSSFCVAKNKPVPQIYHLIVEVSLVLPPNEIRPLCCCILNLCNFYIWSSILVKLSEVAPICFGNLKTSKTPKNSASFHFVCQIVRCSFLCLKILLRT